MKKAGMFERQVSGMISAQAAAGGHDAGMGILALHEIEHFFEDIFFVLQVMEDTFGRGDVVCVKAFLVDAVETIDLDGAVVDLLTKGVDDLPVLVVIEPGGAGGEKEDGVAGMAEDKHLHFPVQVRTEPFMIFSCHFPADRYCPMISFHKA